MIRVSPCLPTRRRRPLRLTVIAALLATLLGAAGVLGPAADAAASTTSQSRYLIRRGDTLSDIAHAHHTSVSAVARANGIADTQLIYAGSWLVIPSGTSSPAGTGSRYTVRSGDTLSGIALRYGLSAQTLAEANGLADPDVVLAGTSLTIPSVGGGASGSSSGQGVASSGSHLPATLRAHSERLALEPVFDRWAAAYGLPPDLLKSLAWMESGWQAGVVSPVGAIGVTQLMPATAAFVSDDLIGAQLNPWVASDNIRMGACYLRYLLDLSGGRTATALAAYYQGFASVATRGLYSDTVAYVDGILAQRSRFR
jgi:LysM repeat protein